MSQIPTPGGGQGFGAGAGAGLGPRSGVGGRMLEGGLCWANDELLAIVALYERPSPRSFTQLYLFAVAIPGGGTCKTAAALALDSTAGAGSYLELLHQTELVDEAISAFSWSRAFIVSVPDARTYEELIVGMEPHLYERSLREVYYTVLFEQMHTLFLRLCEFSGLMGRSVRIVIAFEGCSALYELRAQASASG